MSDEVTKEDIVDQSPVNNWEKFVELRKALKDDDNKASAR